MSQEENLENLGTQFMLLIIHQIPFHLRNGRSEYQECVPPLSLLNRSELFSNAFYEQNLRGLLFGGAVLTCLHCASLLAAKMF